MIRRHAEQKDGEEADAIDYKARAKAVRQFQKEHDLQKVLPDF